MPSADAHRPRRRPARARARRARVGGDRLRHATASLRVLTIAGGANRDHLDVELDSPDDPASDVVIYGTEALGVARASAGCAVGPPGEVRCSAPAGFAGETRVVFRGYEGDDRLRIAPGMSIRFTGGPGDDRLETEPAQVLPVIATGDAGDDTFSGGRGHDALDGGSGADRLEGGHGDDRLLGGGGEDLPAGGAGRDRLDCGPSRGDRARADRRDRLVPGCIEGRIDQNCQGEFSAQNGLLTSSLGRGSDSLPW